MWMEEVVVYILALSENTEENSKNFKSGKPVSGSRFEPGISRIRMNANQHPATSGNNVTRAN
jgi:hypothetical protein